MRWPKTHRTLWLVCLVVFLALVAVDMYRSAAEDKVLEYYARAPLLLLPPIGIGVVVGLVLWSVVWLYEHGHRNVLLWAWGIANAAASLMAAVFCYRMVSLVWSLCVAMRELEWRMPPAFLASMILPIAAVVAGLAISWVLLVRAARSRRPDLPEGTPGLPR